MPCRKSTEKGADFWHQFPFLRAGNCNMISSSQIIVRGLFSVWRWTAHLQLDRSEKNPQWLCSSDTIADLGLLNLLLINKEQLRQQPPGKVIELMLRIRSKLMPHPPANVMCPSKM